MASLQEHADTGGDKGTPENGQHHDVNDDDSDDELYEDSFSEPPEEDGGGFPEEKSKDSSPSSDATACLALSSLVKPSMLPAFVQAGLEQKASFKELKYWIAVSLTLDGRDKITKVLQYAARLLSWWCLSKAQKNGVFRGHSRRFTSLYKSLGTSRKAFRLGRSINEIHKISSMGLLGLFVWHLKQQYLEDSRKLSDGDQENICERDYDTSKENKSGVSSLDTSRSIQGATRNTLFLSRFSKRIRSMLYAVFPSNESSRVVWWKVIGTALKTFGMLGYWLVDNANFLTSSGALDNYSISEKDRLACRKRWQEVTAKKANQFYFFATIIGLATNSYSYVLFQQKEKEDGETKESPSIFSKEDQRKQFSLFLALLKSTMDVIVFSNNPGVDLYRKWRGRKNHEAIHCLCGLVSAGTGLYTNFPDANR